MESAIVLKLLRSTSWARVSHEHGSLLTAAVSVTASGQYLRGIMSTVLQGSDYQMMNMNLTFLSMAMIGLVGYLLDAGFGLVQRRVLWWKSAAQV